MNNKKPFLIIQCEVLAERCRGLYEVGGDIDDLYRDALSPGDHPVVAVRACRDEALPSHDEIEAVLVTGSSSMVADPDPWIGRTAHWLRQAHARAIPSLGVCFGHQLIAHALGGAVRRTPAGAEFTTVTIERAALDPDDPLLGFLPTRFAAQAAHFQSVVLPPPAAQVLAQNDAGIQALRFGPTTWGVQFHPEFDDRHMRLILDNLNDPASRGVDVATSVARLRPSLQAGALFRRFRDLVLAPSL